MDKALEQEFCACAESKGRAPAMKSVQVFLMILRLGPARAFWVALSMLGRKNGSIAGLGQAVDPVGDELLTFLMDQGTSEKGHAHPVQV